MSDNDNTKNNKDDGQQPDERLTAVLRLLADDEAPIGLKPHLLEIQAWHLGKLSKERAEEVKSHVARDPVCYQLWSDLIAEESQAASSKSFSISLIGSYLKVWLGKRPAWWVSGGVVTAMLAIFAVLYVPYISQPWSPLDEPIVADVSYDWPWQGMSLRRGGDLSYRQKIAFQSGMRKGFSITTQDKGTWSTAIASLPDKALSCESEANPAVCEQQTLLLVDTGVHTGVLYMACLEFEEGKQHNFSEDYWNNQPIAWSRLAQRMESYQELNGMRTITTTIAEKQRSAQCESVRELINLSY